MNYDISTSDTRAKTLNLASDEQLEQWANDPECNQRVFCASLLAKRNEAKIFNPRTEVSADARYISGYIVKHLWIIFVLLPVVFGILYEILNRLGR